MKIFKVFVLAMFFEKLVSMLQLMKSFIKTLYLFLSSLCS